MIDNSPRNKKPSPIVPSRPRIVTDSEGVKWTATEAYHFVRTTAHDKPGTTMNKVCLIWFENASGRTASIHLPEGSLASITEEDLLEFLRGATDRKGHQPG